MSDTPPKLLVAQAIADQIWREQTLSSNRMNWNLTFQGFMMAAFAVVAAANKEAATLAFIQIAICGSAFAVSLFTTFGIHASNKQRSYLRQEFEHLYPEPITPPKPEAVALPLPGAPVAIEQPTVPAKVDQELRYPRPFSERKFSNLGRWPAFGILVVLMITWLGLLLLTLPDGLRLLMPVQ